MFWVGVAANAIFPILKGVFGVWFAVDVVETDREQQNLEYALSAAIFCTSLIQIFTGVILVLAIIKIKRTLNKDIQTLPLIIHSTAFGFFLVSISFFAVVYVSLIVKKYSAKGAEVVLIASFISMVLSVIS